MFLLAIHRNYISIYSFYGHIPDCILHINICFYRRFTGMGMANRWKMQNEQMSDSFDVENDRQTRHGKNCFRPWTGCSQ